MESTGENGEWLGSTKLYVNEDVVARGEMRTPPGVRAAVRLERAAQWMSSAFHRGP